MKELQPLVIPCQPLQAVTRVPSVSVQSAARGTLFLSSGSGPFRQWQLLYGLCELKVPLPPSASLLTSASSEQVPDAVTAEARGQTIQIPWKLSDGQCFG